MDVTVYLMRKNGVEVKRELLGDEPRYLGDLYIGYTEAPATRRGTKAAHLRGADGEVVLELADVQIEAMKGPRLALRGIERRTVERGVAEYVQTWLCIQAGALPLQTARERFFQQTGGRQ